MVSVAALGNSFRSHATRNTTTQNSYFGPSNEYLPRHNGMVRKVKFFTDKVSHFLSDFSNVLSEILHGRDLREFKRMNRCFLSDYCFVSLSNMNDVGKNGLVFALVFAPMVYRFTCEEASKNQLLCDLNEKQSKMKPPHHHSKMLDSAVVVFRSSHR